MTAEPTDTTTTSPTPDDSGRSGIRITTSDPLGSLRLAAICAIVLAAGVWAFTEFGIGRNAGSASGGDVSALGVVASELVTSAKTDGGASDAIGGYLPGTGVVLTVHLDELAGADMQDWVSAHLDPYADDLSVLPSGESVVVTVDVASPQPAARVWSLTPDEINRTEGWERLVAPATFIGGEVAVASDDTDESAMDDDVAESMDDDEATTDDADDAGADDESTDDESADDESADDESADDESAPEESANEDTADEDAPEELASADADGDEGGPDPDGEGGFYDSALWSPLFGSWVLSNGIYAQSDATGFGYSAEYLGDTPEQFDVSVSMRAPFGDLNSGLILGIPDRGRKHGGTVIDITGEGTYLRWGAYDDETGEWSFVGGAPIDPALVADEWTELKLEARADRTGIILNGEPIATIDPIEPGFVSLVVSVANIEFKDFVLEPVDAAPAEEPAEEEPAEEDPAEEDPAEEEPAEEDPAEEDPAEEDPAEEDPAEEDPADGGNDGEVPLDGGGDGGDGDGGDSDIVFEVLDDALKDWQLLSGSWTASDGVMSQNNGDGFDQMIHLSSQRQENYRVEVRLRAKEGSRFSGGLLFNIDRVGVRSNSFVFDIVNDGTDVRWATYDENGVFTYLGGVRIADGFDSSAWHTVAVEVRDGRAQFFVDDTEVGASRDVGDSGHVGVVTSLAAMEFENFAVTPIE